MMTRTSHQRRLTDLEAAALHMAIRDRFGNEKHPIELTLGDENGQPFVTIGRGDDEIKIHFLEVVE
jgi:hypothetical protein